MEQHLRMKAAVPAPSALSATWARLRAATWRRLAVVGSLCLGIAVLLTTMDGGGFRTKLLYSVLIGVACTGIVDATRLGAAWWVDRMRKARGLVVQDSAATTGWRGAVPGTILAFVAGPPIGLWLGDQFTGLQSPGLLRLDHAGSRLILFISLGATVISWVVISSMERLASVRTQAEAV